MHPLSILALCLLVCSSAALGARDKQEIDKQEIARSNAILRGIPLFSRASTCTSYGPNYRACGRDGCYDPSQGQVCCSDGKYCEAGEFCSTPYCCPIVCISLATFATFALHLIPDSMIDTGLVGCQHRLLQLQHRLPRHYSE